MPYPVGPAAPQSMMVSDSKNKDESPESRKKKLRAAFGFYDDDKETKCVTKSQILRICKSRYGSDGSSVFVNLCDLPGFEKAISNPQSIESTILKLMGK